MAANTFNAVPELPVVGVAAALYDERFNPLVTLKALNCIADGDLPSLLTNPRALFSGNTARFTEPARSRGPADSIAP